MTYVNNPYYKGDKQYYIKTRTVKEFKGLFEDFKADIEDTMFSMGYTKVQHAIGKDDLIKFHLFGWAEMDKLQTKKFWDDISRMYKILCKVDDKIDNLFISFDLAENRYNELVWHFELPWEMGKAYTRSITVFKLEACMNGFFDDSTYCNGYAFYKKTADHDKPYPADNMYDVIKMINWELGILMSGAPHLEETKRVEIERLYQIYNDELSNDAMKKAVKRAWQGTYNLTPDIENRKKLKKWDW